MSAISEHTDTMFLFKSTNVDETDTGGECMCVLTDDRRKRGCGTEYIMYSWTEHENVQMHIIMHCHKTSTHHLSFQGTCTHTVYMHTPCEYTHAHMYPVHTL